MRQIGRNCAPNLPCENVRSFRFFSAETTDVAPAALPLHFPTRDARTERGKEIKKRRNSKNMKHVAKNMCETSGPPGRQLFPRQRHLVHQELNRWR